MLDDLNLRVGSVTFRHAAAATRNPQDLERRLAATVDAMRMASRLGARVLVLAAGAAAGRRTPPSGRRCVEALTSLAAQGSRLGVQLAAQCPDAAPADVAALLAELPAGLMGVDLSPADLIRSGRSPREFVAALGPHIVHVFANDAVRGAGRRGGDRRGTGARLGRHAGAARRAGRVRLPRLGHGRTAQLAAAGRGLRRRGAVPARCDRSTRGQTSGVQSHRWPSRQWPWRRYGSSSAYFLRWRIFARIRRFLRPSLRRPLPVRLVPKE